jgi:hypothetical protein
VRDVNGLLQASQEYLSARAKLLSSLQLDDKRFDNEKVDPLTLVSEILVAILFQGNLAIRRDQKGFDVKTPQGQLIQVKYVLNEGEKHPLKRKSGWNLCAVVLFRDHQAHMVTVFPNSDLKNIYQAFRSKNKRCTDPDNGFDLTEARFTQMSEEKEKFERLGLIIWNKDDLAQWTPLTLSL